MPAVADKDREFARRLPNVERICGTCGVRFEVTASAAASGRGLSCSTICKKPTGFKKGGQPRLRHGEKTRLDGSSPEYGTWMRVLGRCNNPTNNRFAFYGGRGIKVCPRWQEHERGFENFLADMGRKPTQKHSIERIDNERGYEPTNCRWATHREQMRNTRRNIRVQIGNELLCLLDAVERFGVCSYAAAIDRVAKGWDPLLAASKPGRAHARVLGAKA